MPAIALMGAFLLSGMAAAMGAPAQAEAPVAAALPAYSVTLTGYNAVPGQTDADPSTTANGGRANPAVVAARSRDLAEELPFGTIIEISGPEAADNSCGYDTVAPAIGYRVITDTMNARYRDTIDVLFDTKSTYTMRDGRVKNASTILGSCPGSTIRVVGFVDLTRVSSLPKTQSELAALVLHSGLALR